MDEKDVAVDPGSTVLPEVIALTRALVVECGLHPRAALKMISGPLSAVAQTRSNFDLSSLSLRDRQLLVYAGAALSLVGMNEGMPLAQVIGLPDELAAQIEANPDSGCCGG